MTLIGLTTRYGVRAPAGRHRPPLPAAIQAWIDQGEVHLAAGHYGAAQQTYREAWDAAQQHPAARAEILTRLGLVAKRLGDYNQALEDYNRALGLARQGRDREYVGKILHNMGTVYMALGESQLALDAFEDALEARPTAWGRSVTLTAIATLSDLGGHHERAILELREALRLRRANRDRPVETRRHGEAMTLDRLGTAAKNAGRLQVAREAFEASHALLKESPYITELAIVEANLGRLLIELDDPDAALAILERARSVLAVSGPDQDHAAALLGMAQAYRVRGDLVRAGWAAGRAVEIIEGLREGVPGPHLRATFLASHHAFYESVIEVVMAQHVAEPAGGHALFALELAERAKARSFLDLLRAGPRAKRLARDPLLHDRVRALESSLTGLEHQRLSMLREGASVAALAGIEKAQRALIQQNADVWDEASLREQPLPPRTMPDARRMRHQLDAETRFLVYSLGAESSFLWLVAPDDVEVFRLPGRGDIERVARRARRAIVLSDQPGGRDRRAEIELGALLLPLEMGPLDGRRLVIVADGILQTIPFAALPDPRTGRPLVEGHAVSMVPSISVLAALRERGNARPLAPRGLVVMADPVYGSNDSRNPDSKDRAEGESGHERLRYSRREAEGLLHFASDASGLALSGFDARREAVLDGTLEPFQIVHLSVHGELVEERPELSSLVFSQRDRHGDPVDGRLFMHEIGSLSLPCELIVLSACNSALGKPMRGEGMVGLTRAVFLAGANRALVSLWYVDDRATAELMIYFYRALLRDRLGPAEALRKAQLELQTVDDRWHAPYFWAGFVLQGDWRWPTAESNRS